MIQINKGTTPPGLAIQNAKLLKEMKDSYDKGTRKFSFNESVYKTDEVKEALIACQNNKCCFSEAKFAGDYSPVEHFRPKGRVDAWPTGGSQYPGYYWLAYEWSNLFLCKERINSSEKRNFFPLEDGAVRNVSHHDTNNEHPLLIDAGKENPRDFIRFNEDMPYGVDKRGQINIEFFNLRHKDFVNARMAWFQILKRAKETIELGIAQGLDKTNPIFAPSQTTLRESILPDAQFSSMALDFLPEWQHLV